MDQHFPEARGEEGLNKYVYPLRLQTSKLYANAQLSAYSYTFMQIWWAGHTVYSQHWLSHSIVSVCLALVFGLGQRLCLQKVLNQKPCFKQTGRRVWKDVCRAVGGVTESFKDLNGTDSDYFLFLLNTKSKTQWLFHKAADCNMFKVCLRFCTALLHIWKIFHKAFCGTSGSSAWSA